MVMHMCLDVTFIYILPLLSILLCNPNGTGVIINEHALSKINEIRSAVILQKKKKKWKRWSSQILTCSLGTSWAFFCNNLHSLQITHHINDTAQKNSLFILTRKYLQILDTFYGQLLHNKADQCHHHKTAHVL